MDIRKISFLIGGILVLFAVLFVGFKLFVGGKSATDSTQLSGGTFGTASNVGNTSVTTGGETGIPTSTESSQNSGVTVATVSGGSIPVNDFKSAASTVADPNNAGHYYLAGGTSPALTNPPYQTFYVDSDQSFHITLYQKPFGLYRAQAEQQLMQTLGITQTEMCNLNYYVSAGPGVDPVYSQENVGFSFCPGATVLP